MWLHLHVPSPPTPPATTLVPSTVWPHPSTLTSVGPSAPSMQRLRDGEGRNRCNRQQQRSTRHCCGNHSFSSVLEPSEARRTEEMEPSAPPHDASPRVPGPRSRRLSHDSASHNASLAAAKASAALSSFDPQGVPRKQRRHSLEIVQNIKERPGASLLPTIRPGSSAAASGSRPGVRAPGSMASPGKRARGSEDSSSMASTSPLAPNASGLPEWAGDGLELPDSPKGGKSVGKTLEEL